MLQFEVACNNFQSIKDIFDSNKDLLLIIFDIRIVDFQQRDLCVRSFRNKNIKISFVHQQKCSIDERVFEFIIIEAN